MLIKIKHRWSLEVLFSHDVEDNTMCLTVQAAVEAKANLRGAYLSGANLRGAYLSGANLRDADLRDANLRGAYLSGANLRGAYLSGANLRDADLRDADLRDADLSGADLRGAYLSGANLRDADLRDADLRGADLLPIKADFIEVISRAPLEVPALIAALKEGRVDGSTYEGPCACLVGTIANTRGIDYRTIAPDASRPAERLFMNIKKGDTPETNRVSAIALGWAEEWLATQRAAFAPAQASAGE
ncbi:hypothetical protein ABH944_004830 [Caballeronia udeis]|uniref:Pentapeptide repeat-containing protein n=1 Tax=Caballeronia udeis TaxID=1232866 RepID=A0ABW8MLW0_9BURK